MRQYPRRQGDAVCLRAGSTALGSYVREGALIASGTGGTHTASLDVLRLADVGIQTEAAHCLARFGEGVVSVMDGNGHR